MAEARTHEPLENRLRDFLHSLDFTDKRIRVESIGPNSVIGVVTTPDFEGMDEAERQSRIWAEIHKIFSEQDQRRIEFVFTNTPEEEREGKDDE